MEQQQKMVKVSVEVRNGAVRFRVGVRARSVREALGLVGGTYPRREVRVVFPMEANGFSADGPRALAGTAGFRQTYQQAA